jgi:TRAP-type mannitol/chloroaromatic compound transport system substrate-binding protein
MISQRAALVAVLVAFAIGMVGSLALRPAGGGPAALVETGAEGEITRRINWRLPISISSSLPILGEGAIYLADTLAAASGGAISLTVYDPGEIVPAFSITDAVRDGKVQAGYTWLGYDQGKIPASALLGATPFGLEPWEYMGWWYEGGGRELAQALYEPHKIKPLFCGIIGPETAGWFREPLESLDDIVGLKIRFAGIGGKVFERAGASVTMLPGSELFQALEKGAIDATEFSLPVVDQALGFARVAKNNYFPGWHQPFTSMHLAINIQVWETLSAADQKMLETVCTANAARMLAASEGRQGAVIKGLAALGVTARYLPMDILRELQHLTETVLDEEAAADENFAAILESQRAFSAEYLHWKRLAYLPRDF